jgi:hypothetical protein
MGSFISEFQEVEQQPLLQHAETEKATAIVPDSQVRQNFPRPFI